MSALVVYDDEFVISASVESVVTYYGRSLQLTVTPISDASESHLHE
jgi:hypothetical protein